MASMSKTAHVTWNGTLMEGGGTITQTGSGTLSQLPVSWRARTEAGSATSPEELIAAAHAACYAMALSGALATAGHPATRLEVDARCTFDWGGEAGAHIRSMELSLEADVPGLDQAGLDQAAQGAKDGCPVSRALKGNVDISVSARLAG